VFLFGCFELLVSVLEHFLVVGRLYFRQGGVCNAVFLQWFCAALFLQCVYAAVCV
jgi:hypothetical protein